MARKSHNDPRPQPEREEHPRGRTHALRRDVLFGRVRSSRCERARASISPSARTQKTRLYKTEKVLGREYGRRDWKAALARRLSGRSALWSRQALAARTPFRRAGNS